MYVVKYKSNPSNCHKYLHLEYFPVWQLPAETDKKIDYKIIIASKQFKL